MTREENIRAILECNFAGFKEDIIDVAVKRISELEEEPKTDRLYRWLSDMRLGITPDETVTNIDERNERMIQIDLLDEIIEWLEENGQEPKTGKTGHWIYEKSIENWKCSECGETPKTLGYVGNADFMREHFKFCNHCGCRMR